MPGTDETPSVPGLESYALACRRAGEPLLRCGETWWREVRPHFFRPLLPFLDVTPGGAGLPYRFLGGCQYPAVAGGAPSNSFLAYVAFADARNYCLDQLRRGDRWEVRAAEKRIVVRPVANSAEFKARAHPIYLEFYGRTKYRYLENRVRKPQFDRWVDAEYTDPGLVALGAWDGDSLVAVSLSRVVGDTWIYSSYFASNDALRSHAAGLMLHHVRSRAATTGYVTMVYAGMQKSSAAGASVDAFYLHRGATIVRRPAVLRVNPIARWLLPRVRPALWQRLRGAT